MKPLRVNAVLEVNEDIPERKYTLKSGCGGQFIVIYEDPVDMAAHYVTEEQVPNDIIELLKIEEDKCEFYPRPDHEGVCAAGSEIGSAFVCTKEYSEKCLWAVNTRKAIRDGD